MLLGAGLTADQNTSIKGAGRALKIGGNKVLAAGPYDAGVPLIVVTNRRVAVAARTATTLSVRRQYCHPHDGWRLSPATHTGALFGRTHCCAMVMAVLDATVVPAK